MARPGDDRGQVAADQLERVRLWEVDGIGGGLEHAEDRRDERDRLPAQVGGLARVDGHIVDELLAAGQRESQHTGRVTFASLRTTEVVLSVRSLDAGLGRAGTTVVRCKPGT